MANWLNFGEKKPESKDDQLVELTPAKLKEQMENDKKELTQKIDGIATQITENPTMKAMQEFLDAQRAATERQQQQVQQQQQQNQNKQFENMDETTRQYIDHTLKPVNDSLLWQQGNELRRSIFDNVEVYPMYAGTIKDEVDQMLDKQPVNMRANADVIRNTYAIVCFNHQKEIAENKHKSRLASASTSGNGTGAPSGKSANEPITLDANQKLAAARFGMSEADYAKSVQELQETGQL